MASATSAVGLRDVAAEEARRWLGELDEVDFAVPCAHGRVVLLELPQLELERLAD